jgi:choline dehydrogenase
VAAVRERADFLILGGGTAGCVLADLLSANGATVTLLEAGPDYGSVEGGAWPTDLLDPRAPSDSHDWYPDAEFSLSRARVIGGCSAHNACFVTIGDRGDYDEWAEFAPGWDFDSLRTYLDRSREQIATRYQDEEEIPAWADVIERAAVEAGLPILEDFNDVTRPEGVGYLPCNICDGKRWSTAFAYLDRARGRDCLTLIGNALVDKVILDGKRASGAAVVTDDGETELSAGAVVLAAGAFGSPGILLRSGIGPGDDLRHLGIRVAFDLPGVGRNLLDHPGVNVVFGAAPELEAELRSKEASGRMCGGANMVRAASSSCSKGTWDLHLVPWTARDTQNLTGSEWRVSLSPYLMKPLSAGTVRLRSPAPNDPLDVDLGFLSDPDGADLEVLVDGVELVRRIASTEPFSKRITAEAVPSPTIDGRQAVARWARENVRGYFHPVGSCRMGTEEDQHAVVDGSGRVHGLENLYVCDASVMPTIPRANTNLTTIAVAERIGEGLVAG